MAKKATAPQPTIEDVRKFADQIEAKFGRHTDVAYAKITMSQLSIARYSGGCKVNGEHFVYNPVDDSLIREDVVKFIVGLRDAKCTQQDTQQVAAIPRATADQPEFPF